MKFGVVILGAGASRRMGRPKLLLLWRRTTVVGHLVAQWRELGAAPIIIVLSAANLAMQAELDRLKFPVDHRITNPEPDRGMISSIRCAAEWTGWESSLTHLVISLGDQPHLKPTTLAALLSFVADHPEKICQPAFGGRPRHPVVLPRPLVAQLGSSRDETLAHFLRTHESARAFVEIDDPDLSVDLDTPEDYAREMARLA